MILVSGATGFLGAHIVCELLQHGRQVRAMRRSASSLKEFNYILSSRFPSYDKSRLNSLTSKLEWVEADVLDIPSLEKAFNGITEVYHAAAIVSFLQSERERLMKINAEGTANMVNLALHYKIEKFCHISSIAALGRGNQEFINENNHWEESNRNSNYAISKHKAEMEVWRAIEEGLHAVIINPGVIIGTGDWNKGSLNLIKTVYKGLKFYSEGVNGYVDVRDVARAAVELMDKNRFSERYVLVSENLVIRDFLTMCALALKKRPPSVKVTPMLAELAWRAMGIKRLLTGHDSGITRETARASLNTYYYSNKKLRETGFSFIPMKECIEHACADFLQSQETFSSAKGMS